MKYQNAYLEAVKKGVSTLVLAGGHGKRLHELTKYRAKPALSICAQYQIMDFVISNIYNSKLRDRVIVVTQYMPNSVSDHVQVFWNGRFGHEGTILARSPTGRDESSLYFTGTANAVYQNWYNLNKDDPAILLILGADHVYKQDYRQSLGYHVEKGADLTVFATIVPIEEAVGEFGVLTVDENYQVIGFKEKPANPAPLPNKPGYCLASMGNYVVQSDKCKEMLEEDHNDLASKHDIGGNIIPKAIKSGEYKIFAYPFEDNDIEGEDVHYWSDVGRLPAFLDANGDIASLTPGLNLYNDRWPIFSAIGGREAPQKNVHLCHVGALGSIVDKGADVWRLVMHKRAEVKMGSRVENSVIMEHSVVGHGVQMKNTIVDRRTPIPDGRRIGFDEEEDKANGYRTVPYGDNGHLTLVPRVY